MDFQQILNTLQSDLKGFETKGKVADYIPELRKVSPDKFGMSLTTLDHKTYSFGDALEKFSIQSISKVFTLALAEKYGDEIWQRVGVEPSGNPFNSLMQLEQDKGIPRNPFINAGAIVVADILLSLFENPEKELLNFIKQLTNDDNIRIHEKVALSEKLTGYRNVALVNYMKSLGNIKNDPTEVIGFYFRQCAIEMSCEQLSKAFLIFVDDGKVHGKQILNELYVRRINALMQTCGFYDEAGEFSFKVGLPGKSGVGGGIVAVHPAVYSVAVWSPILNKKGNSEKGMKALEKLTDLTGLSIFL
ncbi:glutaminase [Mesonia sp. K7]|uniref:glutaminase n=1 Tax=Mesonia sp. K7 TaxID=2218606 RepID=UPI000DAA181F|nr:glutaminase [Mesonia sp. K7]PZD79682.1 glutaminase [Mesonia sp. K7]